MNEVQKKVLAMLENEYSVTEYHDDRYDTLKIYTDFGLGVWVEDDSSVFYEINNMPRCHSLMLVVAEIVQSIENILNESEIV